MGVISSLAGKTSDVVSSAVNTSIEWSLIVFIAKRFTDTAIEVTRLATPASAAWVGIKMILHMCMPPHTK